MLSCQRALFSIPSGVHYLNCAYMSPLLKSVEEAGIRGMHLKRAPHVIAPNHFFEESNRARALFARLVNVESHEVALIPSASYGIATVARNLTVTSTQNIVVLHEQFPSNVYSWRRLAKDSGAELRTVAPDEGIGRADSLNARILDAVDDATAVVAVGPVHWADGTRIDLRAIGDQARSVGAAFVVDGTQSVGALPIDAKALGIDALICAAYKWLMGPYSIGAMYLGPRFVDGIPLEETWIARKGSENFGGLVNYGDEYQPGAIRFDVGERSNFILMPMMIAGLEQVLEWGPENIQDYCADLMQNAKREAAALGYATSDDCGAHLFGVRVPPHVPLARLQEELGRRNVSVSLRGENIRIAPHLYNDEEDVAMFSEALTAAAKG